MESSKRAKTFCLVASEISQLVNYTLPDGRGEHAPILSLHDQADLWLVKLENDARIVLNKSLPQGMQSP